MTLQMNTALSLPFAPVDLPERFRAMKEQETTAYKVEDYLDPNYKYEVPVYSLSNDLNVVTVGEIQLPTSNVVGDVDADAEPATSPSNFSAAGVKENWRSHICEWLYQVIDHFDYDREIVAMSMNYLDRYLCKRPVNKRTFQLLAMTSLYLACKVYHQNNGSKLRMSSLIKMGRGNFTEEHITAMERSILNELNWHIRPPTPFQFVSQYILSLEPTACEPAVHVRHDIMDIARFLTELAVIDSHFAPLKPSSIGLAALLTAMEGVGNEQLGMVDKKNFAASVYHIARVALDDPELMDCRMRLRKKYFEGSIFDQQRENKVQAAAHTNHDRMLAATCVDASQGRPCSCQLRGTSHGAKSIQDEHNSSGTIKDIKVDERFLTSPWCIFQSGPVSLSTAFGVVIGTMLVSGVVFFKRHAPLLGHLQI